jgi:hypothetical protein
MHIEEVAGWVAELVCTLWTWGKILCCLTNQTPIPWLSSRYIFITLNKTIRNKNPDLPASSAVSCATAGPSIKTSSFLSYKKYCLFCRPVVEKGLYESDLLLLVRSHIISKSLHYTILYVQRFCRIHISHTRNEFVHQQRVRMSRARRMQNAYTQKLWPNHNASC